VRWPTWLWATGTWLWVAQAVWQGGGGFGVPAAQAGLGVTADGLTAVWTPPVPAYRTEPLPVPRAVEPQAEAQVDQLSKRAEAWEFLTPPLRAAMDEAVAGQPAGRAPWRRVVVEGTGEEAGGARDLAFLLRRDGDVAATSGLRSAHFIIGNGTRTPDGAIERTARALTEDAMVVALVGDFSRRPPTGAQLQALTELADYARAKTGVIPVVLGEASRAPVASSVLDAAFNAALTGHPVAEAARN
jgi:hypothetical protein